MFALEITNNISDKVAARSYNDVSLIYRQTFAKLVQDSFYSGDFGKLSDSARKRILGSSVFMDPDHSWKLFSDFFAGLKWKTSEIDEHFSCVEVVLKTGRSVSFELIVAEAFMEYLNGNIPKIRFLTFLLWIKSRSNLVSSATLSIFENLAYGITLS